jgi:multimeric flavodoxin WrbA
MPELLNERQKQECEESKTDFSNLKATFVNCTLKKSPEESHTEGLMSVSRAIMEMNRVTVNYIRAVDREIATGVWPDMTEHGWNTDEWPDVFDTIMDSDILVIGTPIWLGEKSSVCQRVIERLYGQSG